MRRVLRKIVIREDFRSVSNPELHARGLIPFCRENASLRITRHVSLFESMLPVHSGGQDNRRSDYFNQDVVTGADCLGAMILWIQGASSLHALGMPKESFSLVFDNSVTEGDWVWNAVVMRARALQEVSKEWLRAPHNNPRPYNGTGLSPCENLLYLPSTFEANVRSIAEGNSIMRLTSGMSSVEIEATALNLEHYKHFTPETWEHQWHVTVLCLSLNTDFWRRLHPRYSIEPAGFKRVVTTVRRMCGRALSNGMSTESVGR